ncbi:LacI family DNA-binding transcriptional regulator [Cohnella sp. CFH 77786]|uniref:LacI family DNA-binding transcriptional regulator n=1 Tax=Cohnella sp. CFH 77786 TaxID=2662265 RepID=UPI001C60DD0A|nr:LacI family DNA-binding transcriptional regulator [Cohnella sp. CFH 77786]MBW5447758.1 LacI family DNA-binding transcriptional regulator [Cohnella sp. CFH 77786]
MAVTIKDVARKAGVSPSTVSRVISNHPRISPETSRRVKEIMKQLGYHSNIMARSLVSNKTFTLGMILPRPAEELFQNHFFAENIRGITTQASRNGYDVLMTAGHSEHGELEAVTRLVKGKRVDGIILLQSRKDDPIIAFLKKEDFPFILIGNYGDNDILCVDNDNVQASYDATMHLISQGHHRIGFVSGPPNLTVSRDRLEGYKKALTDNGIRLETEWVMEGEFLQESGYRAMSFFMNLPDRPTALVVIDDIVTFGILRGLSELGYKVPDDLSLVSFNNIYLAELSSPPLSSIDIGIYQLGYMASQLLTRRIQGEKPQQLRTIVPHRLVVRESSLNIKRNWS